jgi:RHS repeat-associated protein
LVSNMTVWSSRSGAVRIGLVGLVCAGLLGGVVTAAHAGEGGAVRRSGSGSGSGSGSAVVGPFAVGDGFAAAVDERDGSVRFGVPAGGVELAWESRAAAGGVDEFGFGAGWGIGLARVGVSGGVSVQLPAGGSYPADASHPSGLSGYGVGDVRFEQRAGVLPARDVDPGVGVPELPTGGVEFSFVLHELGGTVSYFTESGLLAVRVSALDERTDWLWDAGVPGRLLGAVDPDGVVTVLDWQDPGFVLVTPGVNIPGEVDPVTGEVGVVPVWRVELDGGRVSAAVDPTGGRYLVGYDPGSGLVSGVSSASGGSTAIEWQELGDGVARVSRVRTVDADGAELSVRTWAPAGSGTPSSGWPTYSGEGEWFWSGSGDRYETVLSDGATRVVSEYTSQHRLVNRRMVVTTGAGEWVVQEQAFTYPGTDGGAVPDPAALPGNWSRPTSTRITHRDQAGQTRTVSESTEYDELGRQVSGTAADGTVTTTAYDLEIPDGAVVAVGLPVTQTVTTQDGQVEEVRRTLNDAHTAVTVSETWRSRGGEELARVARTEYDVADDGLVTAERVYPAGDAEAEPATTAWDRSLDLTSGTLTVTTTVAAGTPIEAATREVTSLRHGETLASTDAVGNTVRAGFDALGRRRVTVTASGNVSTEVYETAQQDGRNATVATGADGVTTTEVRDTLGRVTQILDTIDHGVAKPGHIRVVETRAYPEPGTTVRTDAWGATTTTRQDVFGREVETVGPTGLTKLAHHDDVADQTTTGLTPTGALAGAERVEVQSRDLSGRVTSATGVRADGVPVPEATASFDGLGKATQSADGTLATEVEYDVHGNPVETTLTPVDDPHVSGAAGAGRSAAADTAWVTASRRFDGFGAPLEKTLTAAAGESRSGGARSLDLLGRTESQTDQLGRVSTISYTIDGLVERVVAGSGQLSQHEYDPVTRRLLRSTVTSPVGETVRTAYEYDAVTGVVLGVFDPADRPGTEIRRAYNAHGLPVTVTYPDGKQIGYGYDRHGRRTHTIDIAGNVTTLEYTPEGLPVRAVQRDADGEVVAEVSYEHDAYGRMTRLSRGNGVVTDYTFTSASEIKTETTTNEVGLVISDRAYTYDPRGNLVERTDTTRDKPDAEPAVEATSYRYDAHDRLTGSTVRSDGNTARGAEYELTVSGDIRTETVSITDPDTGMQTVTTRGFEYTPLGELAAITTTTSEGSVPGTGIVTRNEAGYDQAGNLRHGIDGAEFGYDAANRLVQHRATDGTGTEIGYWADGTRRYTTGTMGGVRAVTGFYWDGAALINDTHAGADEASGVAAYLIGAALHARTTDREDGETAWYGADRHGNVTDLTDQAGAVTTRYAYTDYGIQTLTRIGSADDEPGSRRGLHRNPFGYAGEYTDPDGTQYLRSRIYDPRAMRFTTMDTEELHNLYAYADLNPVTRIDPTGRNGEVDWFSFLNGVMIGVSIATAFVSLGSVFGASWSLFSMARTFALASAARSAHRTVQVVLATQAPAKLVTQPAFLLSGEVAATFAATNADKAVAVFAAGVLDLGSSAIGATLLMNENEHVEPFIHDRSTVRMLEWVEGGATVVGATVAGALFAKSAIKRSRLERLNREDQAMKPLAVCTELENLCTKLQSVTLPVSDMDQALTGIRHEIGGLRTAIEKREWTTAMGHLTEMTKLSHNVRASDRVKMGADSNLTVPMTPELTRDLARLADAQVELGEFVLKMMR